MPDVTLDARLREDLRLDGDDADEFLQAFSHEFKVDLSRLKFTDHFAVESGINPLTLLLHVVFEKRKKSIRVSDLVVAAEAGYLSSEDKV